MKKVPEQHYARVVFLDQVSCQGLSKRRDRQTYLCDEVGVRHEELFQYVDDGKNGRQLVFKSQFGSFGNRRGLLVFSAGALVLAVNAGSAGLRHR